MSKTIIKLYKKQTKYNTHKLSSLNMTDIKRRAAMNAALLKTTKQNTTKT